MNRSLLSGYLLILNTIIFFSTFEVVSRTILSLYAPFQINFLRFFIGGVVLFGALLYRRSMQIHWRDFLYSVMLGVLNVGISMNLLQLSLSIDGASAALTAVLFSTNPVFVVICAGGFGNEKIDLRLAAALVVCLSGVVIIFADRLSFSNLPLLPAVLALASSLIFGVYTVLARNITQKIGSLKMNAYSFLAGSLLFGVPVIAFRPQLMRLTMDGMPQILFLGIVVTGVAYLTYFAGLVRVGAGKGSMVFFLKPVLASVLAALFLREAFTAGFLIGALCIMTGVFLSIRRTV